MTDVKREIFTHFKLKNSATILKLEEIFEHRKELFLVYEYADMLNEDFMVTDIVLDKEKLKKLVCSIMIGLNEINSLRLAVCMLHYGMIARTLNGDYKIFNFLNLNHYNTLKGDIASKIKNFVETIKTKVNPATDSWTLGVFMAQLFKPHTFDMRGTRYSLEYFQGFPKDTSHNPAEKEVFEACLNARA